MSLIEAIECDGCDEILKVEDYQEPIEAAKEADWFFDEETHYAQCQGCYDKS
ncbi:MAG: hypothetical protein KAJ19_06800 [Gammaproteobacteria bacterium]|nr:hypothetical protein [Gammaproteobacteria bacterium]